MDVGLPDVLAAVIAAAATLALFAAFDVMSGGSINWVLDGALAVGAAVATLYFRTADLEDA
jgi:hypothetical protein